MVTVRQRIRVLLRRWQIARYQRQQVLSWQQDRRRAEHTALVRSGIKPSP